MTHCVPVADSDSSLWIFGIAMATIVWSMNVIATANTIAASTRFLFVLMTNNPDLDQDARQGRRALHPPEALVPEPDGHRALADGRCDPLDRARVDVADREDSRPAGLEEVGTLAGVEGEVLGLEVASGEQEAVLVHR